MILTPYTKKQLNEEIKISLKSIMPAEDRSLVKLKNDLLNIQKEIEQEQFVNADITFKDINTLKKIFKKKLKLKKKNGKKHYIILKN